MRTRKIVPAVLSLLFLLFVQAAPAATVTPFQLVKTVAGDISSRFFVADLQFDITEAGVYRGSLSDNAMGTPFDVLAFNVTQGITSVGDTVQVGNTGANLTSFKFFADPGSYTAHLFGAAGEISPGIFLSQLGAEVAMVPVPASLLLLVSALASIAFIRRRKQQQDDPSLQGLATPA